MLSSSSSHTQNVLPIYKKQIGSGRAGDFLLLFWIITQDEQPSFDAADNDVTTFKVGIARPGAMETGRVTLGT